MKTQVSILIKNESLFSRAWTLWWFINIFKKMPMDVYIDSENNKQTLIASDEPYLIDLEPGEHEILFVDPKAKQKKFNSALVGATFGFAAAGVTGGSVLAGTSMGYNAAYDGTVRNGAVRFTLNEGDTLKLQAQAKHNGSVKVKVLKG